ncbi:MAG: insulinase family protein [Deltaproteobacteria bacterium]|nr:insulinase family protein [Deltaproteobacteria bacterium]
MYKKTVLENGVRIITEEVSHVRSVSFGIWVNSGSRDELAEELGISHFIEHMIFKGTETRSTLQIAKEIDAFGGMANAFTNKENTCFHTKVIDKHLPRAVDLLMDIFLRSTYDSGELDRERQVILQEISMVEDTPDELIHILFARHFWEGHPLSEPIAGVNNSVMLIDRDRILRYLNHAYSPGNIVAAAVGRVNHEDLLHLVQSQFATLPWGEKPKDRVKPTPRQHLKVHTKDMEQAHIFLGSPGPSYLDEDRYKFYLLNTILGGNMSSRLFQTIREREGLAYSIYSFIAAYIDTGAIKIYAGVNPDMVAKTVSLVLKEVKRLMENSIVPEELEEAKDHIKAGLLLSAENMDARMNRLAKNEICFGREFTYDETIERIDRVTMDDLSELSARALDPHGFSMTVLGPIDEASLPNRIEDFLGS